jgi:hypothetical protein
MNAGPATKAAPVCPVCGSASVIPILWGRRAAEEYAAAERGEIALGGCFLFKNMPAWYCRDCAKGFGSNDETELLSGLLDRDDDDEDDSDDSDDSDD